VWEEPLFREERDHVGAEHSEAEEGNAGEVARSEEGLVKLKIIGGTEGVRRGPIGAADTGGARLRATARHLTLSGGVPRVVIDLLAVEWGRVAIVGVRAMDGEDLQPLWLANVQPALRGCNADVSF
jgi:hypothetical protein